MDRLDLFVEVAPLEFDELAQRERAETSAQVKERVDRARALQTARQRDTGAASNSQLTREGLDRFCALDEGCQRPMQGAFDRTNMHHRRPRRRRRNPARPPG